MPKADLSKRPVQSKNIDMGMSGTFKKLDIDWTTLYTEENVVHGRLYILLEILCNTYLIYLFIFEM